MATFEPDVPCQVHERLNDRTFDWHTEWADTYLQNAKLGTDGHIYFDGLILDGWRP